MRGAYRRIYKHKDVETMNCVLHRSMFACHSLFVQQLYKYIIILVVTSVFMYGCCHIELSATINALPLLSNTCKQVLCRQQQLIVYSSWEHHVVDSCNSSCRFCCYCCYVTKQLCILRRLSLVCHTLCGVNLNSIWFSNVQVP